MSKLERRITLPVLSILIANSIVGSGIFFMPALAARISGNDSIIAWLLISLISLYYAAVFGELASKYPKAGGIYEYAKQTLGSFPSFLVGWMALIGSNISIVMFVVAAIRYLNPNLPATLKTVISLAFIITFNMLAYLGLKTSMVVLTTLGFFPLLSVIALTIPAVSRFTLQKLFPLLTHPLSAIGYTLFLISDVFFGWESASYLSEEVKNPRKTIPRAMILGTGIVALLVLSFIVLTIGSVGAKTLGSFETPFSDLAKIYFNEKVAIVFTLAAYLSIIGTVADWIVSSPRLVLAMARDKLMIAQLADIHKKRLVPHKAIIFQTIASSLIVLIANSMYLTLVETLLPLTFLLYTILMIALIISRKQYKEQGIEPVFKAPFGIAGPLFIIAFNLAMIGFWIFKSQRSGFILTNLAIFMLVGIPIYLLLNMYYNLEFSRKVLNATARLNLAFEAITLPKSIRKFAINLFGDVKGLNVLELGSGVGTLTLELAKQADRVVAIDMSEKHINIARQRAKELGLTNIEFIHDPHLATRIVPGIGKFHRVYSVGMLSFFQDFKKLARDLHQVLEDNGKICFIEFIDYFKVLPNPSHIRNFEKIKSIFEEQGISVKITKKHGFLWNYLIIYGVKTGEAVPVI